jgi:hypothetical protein
MLVLDNIGGSLSRCPLGLPLIQPPSNGRTRDESHWIKQQQLQRHIIEATANIQLTSRYEGKVKVSPQTMQNMSGGTFTC